MSTLDLSPESRRKPAEVVADVELSEDAQPLLAECGNISLFLQALSEAELFSDAFLTLARALPRQYAIVWANRCVEESVPPDREPADQHCLDCVQRWLKGADEALRRRALEAAEACDFKGECAWLAAAVGFSGGSLAPENQVEVPPPEHLTAVAVSACLTIAASRDEDKRIERAREFLERGLAMAAVPGV